MRIEHNFTFQNKQYQKIYQDSDDFSEVPLGQTCQSVDAVCFYKNKLIIFCGEKQNWLMIGDTLEPDENPIDVLVAIIKKKINAKILKYWPLGFEYGKTGRFYHLRYVCKIEPIGEFNADPASIVKELELIEPKDIKSYLNPDEIEVRLLQHSSEVINIQPK